MISLLYLNVITFDRIKLYIYVHNFIQLLNLFSSEAGGKRQRKSFGILPKRRAAL